MTALLRHKVRSQNATLFECWLCQRYRKGWTSELVRKNQTFWEQTYERNNRSSSHSPGSRWYWHFTCIRPQSYWRSASGVRECPKPRMADYLLFKDEDGTLLDQGIALYFKSPNSFTGEDVLELQGHGGQVVLDLLLKRILRIDGIN